MQWLIRVIVAAALVPLSSCSGGGGDGIKDPLAQPSLFSPSGVREMRLNFGARSALAGSRETDSATCGNSAEASEITRLRGTLL